MPAMHQALCHHFGVSGASIPTAVGAIINMWIKSFGNRRKKKKQLWFASQETPNRKGSVWFRSEMGEELPGCRGKMAVLGRWSSAYTGTEACGGKRQECALQIHFINGHKLISLINTA